MLSKGPLTSGAIEIPLEERTSHAAGVCEHVGDDGHAGFGQYGLTVGSGRTVCALDDHRCLDILRRMRVENTTERCGRQYVAIDAQKIFRVYLATDIRAHHRGA